MEKLSTNTGTDTGNGNSLKLKALNNKQGIENPFHIPGKRLFSLKEASVYMGKTLWGMRQLVWQGRIQIVKDGRKILVDIRDLDNYIEKNKVTWQ